MSTQIYLISEQYIKDNTTITLNVDPKLIIPAIMDAQTMHIMPLLGSSLYNEILNQVSASTLSVVNQTLLNDYIQICLVKWVNYKALPDLLYKKMNKAIVKKSSDNSQPVEFKELIWLMERAKNDAEFYSERLRLYLLQNQNSYPLYLSPGSGVDVIRPDLKSYNTGMYLGRSNYSPNDGYSDLQNQCCD